MWGRRFRLPTSFAKIFYLNLPCFHPFAVFRPPLVTPLHATFESGKEVCARRNLPNPNLLASKRCFSGGADTSRRLLRPCGSHRVVYPMGTDGRNVQSISQPRNIPA